MTRSEQVPVTCRWIVCHLPPSSSRTHRDWVEFHGVCCQVFKSRVVANRNLAALEGLGRAERRGIDCGELKLVCAETLEELNATGENQYLYALCGVGEDIKH